MMNSSYSFQLKLLLFLLLITANTTLTISAGILTGVTKQVKSLIGDHAFHYLWEKSMEKIKQSSSSQPENDQIQGLDLIKQYLFNFGYLKQKESYYDNSLDEKTKSAIKTYQKKFNLQDKGFLLNNPTLQQISLPRCGVPDINFEYSLTGTNGISLPKGNKWLGKDTKLITYGFDPESQIPLEMKKAFTNAFMQWSTTTKVLNFKEHESYYDANIKIGFYIYNEGVVEDVVVGDSVISLQNSFKSGMIRLDASKYWLLRTDNVDPSSWKAGNFDLETVAMHQIGHLLGLDHSFETNSIMYPIINQRKVVISDSDIKNMHQLYNNANYGKFGTSSSLLTSLFIGFAFVAMFN